MGQSKANNRLSAQRPRGMATVLFRLWGTVLILACLPGIVVRRSRFENVTDFGVLLLLQATRSHAETRMAEEALSFPKTENIGYRTPDILFMLAGNFAVVSNCSRSTRTPTPRETE